MANDDFFDDIDSTPADVSFAQAFQDGVLGSLPLLYDSVLRRAKEGHPVDPGALVVLLEAMGRPTLTQRQIEAVALLRYIDAVKAFYNVPPPDFCGPIRMEDVSPVPTHKQVVLKAHELMGQCARNNTERHFARSSRDHAIDWERKTRRRLAERTHEE